MSIPLLDNPLFLLDYDGSLAEIVADPDMAFPHPAVPEILRGLGALYPVYLITGRSVVSLGKLLEVPGLEVVGVHGLETGTLGGEVRPLIDADALAALEAVRTRLPDIAGLRIEDKGLALALHYRKVDEQGIAELRSWAEQVPAGLELLWGKKVLELRPGGHGKGKAARQLAARHAEKTPLFIGDDTTDEEAFKALPQGLTIKVGPGATAARERLAGVSEVVAYLKRYLE